MLTIFYDLETSDRHRVAQILSYSFICVDDNFKPVDELSGAIKISRLQLPTPRAILVNRLDALRHQETAELTEKEAMLKISLFIERQIERAGDKVIFMGFNSARFDLPFLRTSLIRNGLDPYFKGRLIYRDVLFAARRASLESADFPRVAAAAPLLKPARPADEKPRVSLALETLCNAFDLLSGRQSHEARADVLLTIELAKCLKAKFKRDPRTFEAYEARDMHKTMRKGEVFWSLSPNYDLDSKSLAVKTPVTLLDADHRYALWIDLERYKAGRERRAINWTSQSGGSLYMDREPVADPEWAEVARSALQALKAVNLRNFFETSRCDIEQDIYRLDISLIDMLKAAIWRGGRDKIEQTKNKDLKVVLLRHDLANYVWGGDYDAEVSNLLKQYALYRYGGKILLDKFERDESEEPPEKHPTLAELMSELDELAESGGKEDRVLLESLREFYIKSDIYRVAGNELLGAE